LLRVAERVVRKIYEKHGGKDSDKKTFDYILGELDKMIPERRDLIYYLHYIRKKRNKAHHPIERFSQEESEMIFMLIQNVLREIQQFNNTSKKGSHLTNV
jgi:hypothetical protein